MKNILIFLAGGAVGAVVSAKLVEKYYRDLADEEIESVVEHFKKREKELEEKYNKVENKSETENKPKKNKKKDKVEEIIKTEGYSPENEEIINKPVNSIVGFEIIDPMDFGEEDGYDTKSWMYWNDNVLTNELDEIVNEPSEYIGDALSHFGDYEEDSVYVRNHASKTDYEILRSEKEFNA